MNLIFCVAFCVLNTCLVLCHSLAKGRYHKSIVHISRLMLLPRKGLVPILILLLPNPHRIHSQEKPIFLTQKYTNGPKHRQNFCDLQESARRNNTLRYALRGREIKVAVPSFQLNENNAIDETEPDIAFLLLDEIARRAGFTYRNSFGVVDPPGGNETWDDLLQWVVGTYDMFTDWSMKTPERVAEGVLFNEGWYDGKLIMVEREGVGQPYDYFFFLKPFSMGSWFVILALIPVSGVAYFIADYIGSRSNDMRMETGIQKAICKSFFAFTGHANFRPTNPATRGVAWSICFTYLVVTIMYTANLTSMFIRSKNDVYIASMEDAIRARYKFCVENGTLADRVMAKIYPKATLVHKPDMAGTLEDLKERKCDALVTYGGKFDRFKRDKNHNSDCAMKWLGRAVQYRMASFAIHDNISLCAGLLNDIMAINLIEMKEDGTFQKIWDDFLDKHTTVSCEAKNITKVMKTTETKTSTHTPVTVHDCAGILILHSFLLFVALTISLTRFYLQPKIQKQRMIKEILLLLEGRQALKKSTLNRLAEEVVEQEDLQVETNDEITPLAPLTLVPVELATQATEATMTASQPLPDIEEKGEEEQEEGHKEIMTNLQDDLSGHSEEMTKEILTLREEMLQREIRRDVYRMEMMETFKYEMEKVKADIEKKND